MVDFQCKPHYGYEDLLRIMELLRAPGGCPWDREQTHESLRRNFLEESCEVVEAIDRGDRAALCEELGDALLQVVFHAQLEKEQGGFNMDDVADGICKKLVYRHPHVFGTAEAKDTSEVLDRWETLKRREKGQKSAADTVDSVARTLPALWRAEKIQGKTAKAGFDWPDGGAVLDKLDEEADELRQAAVDTSRPVDAPHGVKEEVGDVLFIAAKIAQRHGVDPEEALHASCDKFARRFRFVEEHASAGLSSLSPEEKLSLWKRSKQTES
jgi:MazG family protein